MVSKKMSVGLRLIKWKGVSFHGPISCMGVPVRILGIWFCPGLQLEMNLSGVQKEDQTAASRGNLSSKGSLLRYVAMKAGWKCRVLRFVNIRST